MEEPKPDVLLSRVGTMALNGISLVRYSVLTSQPVDLILYDVQGRRVRTLASGSHTCGEYSVSWDGSDDNGRRVPCGTYLLRLKGRTVGVTRKVVLAR